MNNIRSRQGYWDSQVRKNISRLNYWTSAWVLSIGILAIGPRVIWNFNTTATVFVGLINLAIGVGMILANIRFIKGQDEMQQKIFLEAAAFTLGVTVVFGGSYQLWGDITRLSFEPQVWHLMCVMGLAFITGMSILARKYQ